MNACSTFNDLIRECFSILQQKYCITPDSWENLPLRTEPPAALTGDLLLTSLAAPIS